MQHIVTTWRPVGWGPAEGTWIGPRRPPCKNRNRIHCLSLHPSAVIRDNFNSYLGLMRLATVMMSLRLAGALTFAPEPIVIATSFSVRVWQICTRELCCELVDVVTKRTKMSVGTSFTFKMEMQ